MLIQIFDRLFDRNVGLGELRIAVVTNDPSDDGRGFAGHRAPARRVGGPVVGNLGEPDGKVGGAGFEIEEGCSVDFHDRRVLGGVAAVAAHSGEGDGCDHDGENSGE